VVGSNIFNTLWILGVTGFVSPLPGYEWINVDLTVNLVASMLIFIFAFTFAKNLLDRKEWVILLCWYFLYIGYLVNTVL
jgi:cation:H+ antiporter